ncbi:smoothelin, like [Latimeria chalumnae]|uniref:Smoothelin, like n=1 Tax=Latimeria chalumnae TaxID=7897 RepID=H3BHJ3_LATCH|nr:PREDICTED: smoothelin-like protein 2 [Latimeria chalumnae]|eukprot:XP_005987563.1 PREDICTED: smoothelin-like protein 2 [Latimeria chalumnae]
MDANEIADLSNQDAQTVCEALGRYEDTLRDAVKEIHVDIQVFKKGVDKQIEDVLNLVSPLSRTIGELQQENQRLRGQVEQLAGQVDFLTRSAGPWENWATEKNGNLPSSPARFSSHATFSVSNKANNAERAEQSDTKAFRSSNSATVENGHQSVTDSTKGSQEKVLSQHASNSAPQEQAPSVAMQLPYQPVSAVTRVAERLSGELSTSQESNTEVGSCSTQRSNQNEAMIETPSQPASVKTWSPSPVRTMGITQTSDKTVSVTKSASAVSYSMSSGIKTSDRAFEGYFDVTPKSRSPPPAVNRQVEKRRELVRSQTLPRSSGTQARKAIFEKFEQESGKGKGETKAKLKRSQSFGVPSANSIKQILLEWCRSKTIGYKSIDIQNFSSSWSDGMAFCALIHSFFPEAFDYDSLQPSNRKHNFELAFTMAEKLANCDRLIEVDDMMVMGRKPDPMCVFTYVQSLYNHLRRFE